MKTGAASSLPGPGPTQWKLPAIRPTQEDKDEGPGIT